MDEGQARVVLCGQLPALRRLAQEGGWSAELSDALRLLETGGSALDVLTRLDPDLNEQADDRGPLHFLLPGAPDAPLVGAYICPRDWCDRRATRAAGGPPPVCALRKGPMRFTEAPERG